MPCISTLLNRLSGDTPHNSSSTMSTHSMSVHDGTWSCHKLTYLLLRLEKLCFLLHSQPRKDETDLTYHD